MTGPANAANGAGRGTARRYDSPVRRLQMAETRERIVAAGAALLHEHPIWDWRVLTARAVAASAGVSERTVYRHFSTERALRDTVLERLREEAGIDIGDMSLHDVAGVTDRMLRFVAGFPIEARTPGDPTLAAANEAQRSALLAAVTGSADRWTPEDRAEAAAVLDALWSVVTYERLVAGWELQPDAAIRAITWAIGLVVDAIDGGNRPGPG